MLEEKHEYSALLLVFSIIWRIRFQIFWSREWRKTRNRIMAFIFLWINKTKKRKLKFSLILSLSFFLRKKKKMEENLSNQTLCNFCCRGDSGRRRHRHRRGENVIWRVGLAKLFVPLRSLFSRRHQVSSVLWSNALLLPDFCYFPSVHHFVYSDDHLSWIFQPAHQREGEG